MERTRRWMLGVLVLAFVGTSAELLLIGHTEEIMQLLPLILLGLGLVATGAVWLRPKRTVVQLFRLLSGLFIVAGVLGVILHYRGNAEFELEMRSSMAGLDLVWNSLTGATPALAPGGMIPLGLIGLIAMYRHPAMKPERTSTTDRGNE
ncbi:MAG: hypothetical protein OEU54_06485 [Gemmatimonadota bacterium]|nr:hypothetical protein [Gemmatimonadota bacterium]